MLTQLINGRIFTPQGWLTEGSVLMRDGKILEVTNCDLAVTGAHLIDARGMDIVPGFICMHAHGGGGHDFTECTDEAFQAIIDAHTPHGATTFVPTLSSSPLSRLKEAAEVCQRMMAQNGSPIMGLHIEGPYLSPKMAGEQFADQIQPVNEAEYRELIAQTHCIRRWDAAPELPGALEFGRYLVEHGIVAAVSHTEAEYDDIKKAYEAGYTHAAHFYNAMPGFHKRREYKYEGTVESVYLTDGMTIELIADGIHLPATILRLAYKLKGVENTCLVTDALSCTATDLSQFNDPRYVIEHGVCKLADRSALAGSIATSDVLVRTMVKAGIPLGDAIRMASETPARIMGVSDRKGSLQKGKDADVLILDKKMNVRAVWQQGELKHSNLENMA